jgi:predicted RNA-binding Zn-ribbon protein involved in translation (DUF1610 family)
MLAKYLAAVLTPPEHRRAVGWVCPTCGGAYAPWVATCLRCPPEPPTPLCDTPEGRAVAEWLERKCVVAGASPRAENRSYVCPICGWVVAYPRWWTASPVTVDARPLHPGCVDKWEKRNNPAYEHTE